MALKIDLSEIPQECTGLLPWAELWGWVFYPTKLPRLGDPNLPRIEDPKLPRFGDSKLPRFGNSQVRVWHSFGTCRETGGLQ